MADYAFAECSSTASLTDEARISCCFCFNETVALSARSEPLVQLTFKAD